MNTTYASEPRQKAAHPTSPSRPSRQPYLRWVLSLSAISLAIVVSACVTTRTTTERDVFTEGAVTSATPPQLIGSRTKEGEVSLTGSFVESNTAPRADNPLQEGGSGNAVIRRQAKGAITMGTSERVALGVSGRYSGRGWGRDSQAINGDADSIPGSLGAVGFVTRIGFVNKPDFELNLDLESEVISFPYHRQVIGTETTEYWDDKTEAWEELSTFDLEPRGIRQSELAMTAHIGLSSVIRFQELAFIAGGGLQFLPTVDGHQRVTTTCVDFQDCNGPESADEIDVHTYQTVVTGYAGFEFALNHHLMLGGIVFGGFTELEKTGLATPGVAANLKLRI